MLFLSQIVTAGRQLRHTEPLGYGPRVLFAVVTSPSVTILFIYPGIFHKLFIRNHLNKSGADPGRGGGEVLGVLGVLGVRTVTHVHTKTPGFST